VSESRSGEHRRELVERFQAVVSERSGAAGALTAEVTLSNVREATEQAAFVLAIKNGTDSTITVGISYATTSGVQDALYQEISAGEVGAFQLAPLGQCDSLLEYIMGCWYDDKSYFSPEDYEENGGWTPEKVSQQFPNDTDPCSDGWYFGSA
jgi:hypothetical protein